MLSTSDALRDLAAKHAARDILHKVKGAIERVDQHLEDATDHMRTGRPEEAAQALDDVAVDLAYIIGSLHADFVVAPRMMLRATNQLSERLRASTPREYGRRNSACDA